jgi:hypothetical protein
MDNDRITSSSWRLNFKFCTFTRLLSVVAILNLQALLCGNANADGEIAKVSKDFTIQGLPISPLCLLPFVPAASGNVSASQIPLKLPSLRGCVDGNQATQTTKSDYGVVAKTQNGSIVGYKLLGHFESHYLIRTWYREEGSLTSIADVVLESCSVGISLAMLSGRLVENRVPVLQLRALAVVSELKAPSIWLPKMMHFRNGCR